jgi:hypothetical protein
MLFVEGGSAIYALDDGHLVWSADPLGFMGAVAQDYVLYTSEVPAQGRVRGSHLEGGTVRISSSANPTAASIATHLMAASRLRSCISSTRQAGFPKGDASLRCAIDTCIAGKRRRHRSRTGYTDHPALES